MKKIKFIVMFFVVLVLACSCKSIGKVQYGDFTLINYSEKVIEFIWIAPEGSFYPTATELSVGYGDEYEVKNLNPGIYDIAVDFKGEFNSYNSKKKTCPVLKIERGVSKTWIVDTDGKIVVD